MFVQSWDPGRRTLGEILTLVNFPRSYRPTSTHSAFQSEERTHPHEAGRAQEQRSAASPVLSEGSALRRSSFCAPLRGAPGAHRERERGPRRLRAAPERCGLPGGHRTDAPRSEGNDRLFFLFFSFLLSFTPSFSFSFFSPFSLPFFLFPFSFLLPFLSLPFPSFPPSFHKNLSKSKTKSVPHLCFISMGIKTFEACLRILGQNKRFCAVFTKGSARLGAAGGSWGAMGAVRSAGHEHRCSARTAGQNQTCPTREVSQ